MGFLDNRIYLQADYYNKLTNDLLINLPVPSISGFSNIDTNLGRIENKGWEFTITSHNLIRDFKWNTDFNISFNDQKVLELGPEGDPLRSGSSFIGNTHITEVGQPMGQFVGLKIIGLFTSPEQLTDLPTVNQGRNISRLGDYIYQDTNLDGEITLDDRVILGSAHPDFVFGMTNRFSYKNFGLSVTMRGSYGNEVINLNFSEVKYKTNANQPIALRNRWKSPEEPGDGHTNRVVLKWRGTIGLDSDLVEDGSFLSIQNVTFDYTLPNSLVKKAKIDDIRLYTSIQNLFMFTNYTGFNPEAQLGPGSGNPQDGYATLSPGVDWGSYPLARTIIFGVSLTF
jgi:hypothetical protein